MPKYKILNSLRNNNNLNIYMKNREEIYKDLYKNVGIKSELMDLLHKNKSIMDKTEGKTGENIKIVFNQLYTDIYNLSKKLEKKEDNIKLTKKNNNDNDQDNNGDGKTKKKRRC